MWKSKKKSDVSTDISAMSYIPSSGKLPYLVLKKDKMFDCKNRADKDSIIVALVTIMIMLLKL